MGKAHPFLANERSRYPVFAGHAFAQRLSEEGLLLAVHQAVGKQPLHQHRRPERRSAVGIGFGMVGRHLRLRIGYLKTGTGNERRYETVGFGDTDQPLEHQVACIVVALQERITQQISDRQREHRLPMLLQHGAPGVGIQFIPLDVQQRVERKPFTVELTANRQRLMNLEHAHHGIDALIVDRNGIAAVYDDSHADFTGIARHDLGDGIGQDIRIVPLFLPRFR